MVDIPGRKSEEHGILTLIQHEINHMLYHTQHDSIPLDEYNRTVQHIINDLYSLIGYGTAAEPALSGEDTAFQYAVNKPKLHGDSSSRIVMDVGSHEGEYLKEIKRVMSWTDLHFDVHCFEPGTPAFLKLKEIASAYKAPNYNIAVNNIAISDRAGPVPLYSHIAGAAQSTLSPADFKHEGAEFIFQENVTAEKLQSYCDHAGIATIDFLKLDTEGHEYTILKSILPMIAKNRIRFLQFEFGANALDNHISFKDIFNLLNKYYKLYRIHPYGLIPVVKYSESLEVYQVVNYLCELIDDNPIVDSYDRLRDYQIERAKNV